ncbi:MBOAT family O-acyltransferase [Helicobacter sp. T3_23-1056]
MLGIIFNLSLLCFFKYTDFLLENFNLFSQIAHLDFEIPLPHILLPLALSFVTFQQIAFLFDCYKHATGKSSENLKIDFIDYALFISFFPQLIAGPIVHHREMMPQFAKMGTDSSDSKDSSLRVSEANAAIHNLNSAIDCHDSATFNKVAESRNDAINYEYLAKGIFIFSIGLFKKVFIADSFAKWANAGFGIVENGGHLNIAESWTTSLSYTFQLYFDFSGYCDMAMGLALSFGIVLPLNFNSPYKSLNIAEFWRRWHITLGRFLKECLYIPLGGSRVSKILNLRNLFIVAFLSGIWHGAGWGFVIWGVLHGVAMVIHRVYSWFIDSLNANISSLRDSQRESKQSTNQTRIATTSSLRDSALAESWQSTNSTSITEDNSTLSPSLAEGDKGGGLKAQNNSGVKFSNDKYTHPLTPSAREGENLGKYFAREGGQIGKSHFLAFTQSKIYKILAWFITFNFINIAWVFFRAENVSGAANLLKGMFGIVWVDLPQKWHRMPETLAQISGRNDTIFYIIIAIFVCVFAKNSFEKLQNFSPIWKNILFATTLTAFALFTMLANDYSPFLYFNF